MSNDPRGNLAPGTVDGAPGGCGDTACVAAGCARTGRDCSTGGRGVTGVENAARELAEIMREYRLRSLIEG